MKFTLRTTYFLLILTTVWGLTACAVSQDLSTPVIVSPQSSQTSLPTSIVTLLPEATATPAPVMPAVSATPTETEDAAAATAPASVLSPDLAPLLTPEQPRTQAWQDCSLAPGWVGCDANAPALAAHLAFFVPGGPAVVVLDLQTSTGWSAPSSTDVADPRLAWSLDGQNLLVALSRDQAAIYGADSTPRGSLALGESVPEWQPDGALALPETVHSQQGAAASLVQADDLRWQVRYESAPGEAPVLIGLEPMPSDLLFHLVGFMPGTDLLLGQSYYAGNQVMMQGASLFTLDLATGERRDLDAKAPLGWQAAYAWQTPAQSGQPGLLAFTDTRGLQVGLATLSILNFGSSDILQRPIPLGVAVGGLAWQPNTNALAFAGAPVGELSAVDAAIYTLPAIYLLDPSGGPVRALTQPPSGTYDGLPVWSSDGQWLLYARYFASGALEVRAVQPSNGQDFAIVQGLLAGCPADGLDCAWGRWLSIAAR